MAVDEVDPNGLPASLGYWEASLTTPPRTDNVEMLAVKPVEVDAADVGNLPRASA